MEEFQDGFPDYERIAQHDAEAGKGVRKHLMQVFWLLFAVTIIELAVGFAWSHYELIKTISKSYLIIFFVTFTLVKAGYIVMAFMHLGDENKWLRWAILGPYALFIVYLIYMTAVTEGTYVGVHSRYKSLIEPVQQMNDTPSEPAHHE